MMSEMADYNIESMFDEHKEEMEDDGWNNNQPLDAQPVDAFETVMAEWESGCGCNCSLCKELRARLRAARCLTVTDGALEEALRQLREGHECNRPDCHLCEAAYHIRNLFAAALQQHPTGCYSRDEVREIYHNAQSIEHGRRQLQFHPTPPIDEALSRFDAQREKDNE
jgi:hypothetical protein